MYIGNEIKALENIRVEEKFTDDLNEQKEHGLLVSNLALMLSRELGCDDAFCEQIAEAGILHDIGKLQLSEYLYGRRENTLKIEEMRYVRMHPQLGYEMMVAMNRFPQLILDAILRHHENYDGSGYPGNLVGTNIPYAARILRICDVFSALCAHRPYRAAFDIETVIELMIEEVKNFDMEMFLAFLKVVHSDEFKEIEKYITQTNLRRNAPIMAARGER